MFFSYCYCIICCFVFYFCGICCDRYAITEMMKQKNRMPFGKQEETSLG